MVDPLANALGAHFAHHLERVERGLDDIARRLHGPEPLPDAMRYALLGGGKRIRPVLCLATCTALGAQAEDALAPALALELVHTYSLVHDDLPCMDDDDERRGRPTLHRVHGEDIAILAGDALLTEAFLVIACDERLPHPTRTACARHLATAAGASGMVGGQVRDIRVPERSAEAFRTMHAEKTGALFVAATTMAAEVARSPQPLVDAMARFGAAIGEAFQVADDLLDNADPTSAHEDDVNLVALLGREETLRLLARCTTTALEALAPLEQHAYPLRALARAVQDRVPQHHAS
ncbi:MAG: polyprenyl synthetase family protein [Deltaproteobacteria bacterium]|nr:MAG: polyprenyl synthetase family protein [Deltaproteobacteria bacterium]